MVSTDSCIDSHIRSLVISDAPQITRLHTLTFPDYFLTHMGERFLEVYYSQFVGKFGYGVVAVCDDQVIGFVVGTNDPSEFYKRFYKQNFLLLTWITIQRFFKDGLIRREIFSRINHITHAVRSMFYPVGRLTKLYPDRKLAVARLLSISVDQGFRGRGLVQKMVDQFCVQLLEDEVESVGLSVLVNNHRAINFYEKTGWQVEDRSDDAIYYILSTKTRSR